MLGGFIRGETVFLRHRINKEDVDRSPTTHQVDLKDTLVPILVRIDGPKVPSGFFYASERPLSRFDGFYAMPSLRHSRVVRKDRKEVMNRLEKDTGFDRGGRKCYLTNGECPKSHEAQALAPRLQKLREYELHTKPEHSRNARSRLCSSCTNRDSG